MDNIYRILKRDFGLRDKHVMVLHALEQQEQKAEDLCKVTHIPQGRIYEYLNTLVESGLVSRSHKKPYLYSVPDFKKNVVWFTKQKIDGMVKAQDELLETLKQPSSNVALINNSAMFSKTHCDIITKARIFRMIGIHHSLPFMLYPEELDEFKALRRVITSSRPTIVQSNGETTLLVYKTYMDAFKKGKSMSGIFEKDTFNRHMQLFERAFEKQQFLAMLDSMIAKIKKYHIDLFVLDEFSAMQIDFNEKEVCLSVNYAGVTSGFHIRSRELASFFNRVFLEKMKRAENVLQLLEEKRKAMKTT